jgi:hypothetical protein
MCLKVEASSFEIFGYAQRKWWATKNLSNPLSDLSEMVSCKHISVVIMSCHMSVKTTGVEPYNFLKSSRGGFTPFWFELRPVHIQHREPPLAKRAPFPCWQSLLHLQSRDLLQVEQRLVVHINSIRACVGHVAIALSSKMHIILFGQSKQFGLRKLVVEVHKFHNSVLNVEIVDFVE